MAKLIEGYLMEEVWLQILRMILDEGQELVDQRGSKTKEILNLVWVVADPEGSGIPKKYPLKLGMDKYKMQMLDKELHGHPYTYGNRLRDNMVFLPKQEDLNEGKPLDEVEFYMAYTDQIARIRDILAKNRNTRRATAVTWKIPFDLATEEVPCLIQVDFKIRPVEVVIDGKKKTVDKLFTTGVWRSHDAFGAIPANFVALRELSRYMVKGIENLEMGDITVHSESCHIYEHNYLEADNASKIYKKYPF